MPSQYVFVEPDPFSGTVEKLADTIPRWDNVTDNIEAKSKYGDAYLAGDTTYTRIRPFTGIAIKPDTVAFVQVIDKAGKRLDTLSNNTMLRDNENSTLLNTSSSWTDWSLQTVSENRVEKTQILDTFGATYLYAFGERPIGLRFTGVLLNTADFQWRAQFWENWNNYFRATKLVERNARMYIGWDDIIVEGYPLNAEANENANDPNSLVFSFTFFVTNYISVTAKNDFTSYAKKFYSKFKAESPDAPDFTIAYNGFESEFDAGKDRLPVSTRRTLSKYLGTGLIDKAMWAIQGTIKDDYPVYLKDLLNLAARTAAHAGQAAYRALWYPNVDNAKQLLNSFILQTTYDTLRTAKNYAVSVAEEIGNLKAGEINAMYGFVSTLLSHCLPGMVTASTQNYGLNSSMLFQADLDSLVRITAYATAAPIAMTSALKDKKTLAMDERLSREKFEAALGGLSVNGAFGASVHGEPGGVAVLKLGANVPELEAV